MEGASFFVNHVHPDPINGMVERSSRGTEGLVDLGWGKVVLHYPYNMEVFPLGTNTPPLAPTLPPYPSFVNSISVCSRLHFSGWYPEECSWCKIGEVGAVFVPYLVVNREYRGLSCSGEYRKKLTDELPDFHFWVFPTKHYLAILCAK